MSILRYLNKHHGWYDGKRTPYTGVEEVAAAEVIGEVIAPEVVGAGAAEAGYTGATAYEAGLAGTAGNAALYGSGEGALASQGALYGGSELATEQAAQEAARQAAIQNAGNAQLANVPANQFASGPATSDIGGYQSQQELVNQIANARPEQMVPNNPLPPGFEPAPVNTSYAPFEANYPTGGLTPAEMQAGSGIQGIGPNLAGTAGGNIPVESGLSQFMPSQNQLMVGGGLYALNSMMNADKNRYGVPAAEKYSGPLSKMRYDPNTYQYNTPVNRQYTPNYSGYAGARYAEGGIADIDQDYAKGGIAGLLKGRGDGMSDSIPATIANKQPARLADGEFVVPADVVSHLGNGSTDAGAKHLYKMMDKVRHARTGSKKQGKQIAAGGYLPIK